MKQVRKYSFDLSFDEEERRKREAREAALRLEAQRDSEVKAQIEAATKEGWQQGYEQGKQEGKEEKQQEITSLVAVAEEGIAEQLSAIAAKQDAILDRNLKEVLTVAITILKKLFPAFAAKRGVEEIQALIPACVDCFMREPRILVRAHPEGVALLEDSVGQIAKQVGYDGKIAIIPHSDMAPDGCRIEWEEGAAERDSRRIWDEINAILKQYLKTDTLDHLINTDGDKIGDDKIGAKTDTDNFKNVV